MACDWWDGVSGAHSCCVIGLWCDTFVRFDATYTHTCVGRMFRNFDRIYRVMHRVVNCKADGGE